MDRAAGCPWGVPWGRGARVEVRRVWCVGGVLVGGHLGSKHYAIKVAFLNEKYKEGVFAYKKVSTKFEIADAFTKALPRDDFCRFRQWMGVT